MTVGACSLAASFLLLFIDWPALFRSVGFLAMAVLCFAYWRYLLPKAKHISKIRSILYGEKQQ